MVPARAAIRRQQDNATHTTDLVREYLNGSDSRRHRIDQLLEIRECQPS